MQWSFFTFSIWSHILIQLHPFSLLQYTKSALSYPVILLCFHLKLFFLSHSILFISESVLPCFSFSFAGYFFLVFFAHSPLPVSVIKFWCDWSFSWVLCACILCLENCWTISYSPEAENTSQNFLCPHWQLKPQTLTDCLLGYLLDHHRSRI